MNIYAFDCDETLEISGGPVTIESLVTLRGDGHVLVVCGNWAHVTRTMALGPTGDAAMKPWMTWHRLFSCLGQIGISKSDYLRTLSGFLPTFDDYVFVGNDHSRPRNGGWSSPNDALFAVEAGWRFINETDFAEGAR